MNRHERRTKGKRLIERLQILKNSPILQELDLKDLPQEVLDSLIANTCENRELQKKYNRNLRILTEITDAELTLNEMRRDLAQKLDASKKHL